MVVVVVRNTPQHPAEDVTTRCAVLTCAYTVSLPVMTYLRAKEDIMMCPVASYVLGQVYHLLTRGQRV